MLTAADVHLTPQAVIRATLAVITARGRFVPFDHAAQAAARIRPTAAEVEALLLGAPLPDADALARAATETPPATVDAVHRWALTLPADPTPYRQRLARLAATDRIRSRDIPTLAASVDGWQRTRHAGAVGDRLTTTAHVTTVVCEGPIDYRPRYRVRLRDLLGRVLIWPASPRTSAVPEEGATITITGTVDAHDWYRDTAQTYLTRCRWTHQNDTR